MKRIEYTYERNLRNMRIGILFSDVSKVFNRVWYEGLFRKIKKMSYPLALIQQMVSYLTGRSFQVRICPNQSDSRQTEVGPSQGIVPSTKLDAKNGYFLEKDHPSDVRRRHCKNITIVITRPSHRETLVTHRQAKRLLYQLEVIKSEMVEVPLRMENKKRPDISITMEVRIDDKSGSRNALGDQEPVERNQKPTLHTAGSAGSGSQTQTNHREVRDSTQSKFQSTNSTTP